MTTGPAMVVADGRFNGQRTSFWVNAGEETLLRINKAHQRPHPGHRTRGAAERWRSRSTWSFSTCCPVVRDVVWIGGRAFRKAPWKANCRSVITGRRRSNW